MSIFHQIVGPLHPVLDWPMSTGRDGGYNFFSGLGLAVFWPLIYWRRNICHAPWCLRLGKHPTDDGHFKLCRKHHPDVPVDLTLRHIHRRHEAASR